MRSSVRSKERQKIIIVGAGMSGLTAGAYLSRSGQDVVILEKTSQCGGLVSSFEKEGFLFDTGPRAIGNAGILLPMLKDLKIDLPFVKNELSTGIADQIIHFNDREDIQRYLASLRILFPDSLDAIKKLEKHISVYTDMARTLSKVANPYFKNILKDPHYLFLELLPWLPSFLGVIMKSIRYNKSIEVLLASISRNQSFIDMVSQHFFKGTPAQFALGYYENFIDYLYPLGGTAKLPQAIESKIKTSGGIIHTNTEIISIDPHKKTLRDQNGQDFSYDKLLWAADLKTLYKQVSFDGLSAKYQKQIKKERDKILSAPEGESVYSIFLALDKDHNYFQKISKGHFIYTPRLKGLGELHRAKLEQIKTDFATITKKELFNWLKDFCVSNSYEISIPVLKDKSLAPEQKTGIIVSVLIDGKLFELIKQRGWYSEFKSKIDEYIIDVLDHSIYPGLKQKILFKKSASPLTLKQRFNTSQGAITGWSLEEPSPVPSNLLGIQAAISTPLAHIYKAGQWSYSPSGVPIAILTGRIAAKIILNKI